MARKYFFNLVSASVFVQGLGVGRLLVVEVHDVLGPVRQSILTDLGRVIVALRVPLSRQGYPWKNR